MHDQTELQATQHIIDLFENSKSHTEDTLESLPGIYAVIEHSGNVLKGNRALASLFEVDHEGLLGCSLTEFFSTENWQSFQKRLSSLKPGEPGIDFQTALMLEDGMALDFIWFASSLKSKRVDMPPLFTVLGRDVTDLNRATEHSTRMQMELNTAKTVQDTLFPKPFAQFGTSEISGFYESASECGGDWWHYTCKDEKLLLWIGDVTGHGVPAALLTSAVHSAVSIIEGDNISPTQALALLNKAVDATAHGQRVMTFLIFSLDMNTGECVFSSAAHEPALVIPHGSKSQSVRDLRLLLTEPALPLGAAATCAYREYTTKLQKGDRLFMYTDGIYDVVDAQGQSWNRSKFRRELAAAGTNGDEAIHLTDNLCRSMNTFRKGTTLIDDVTFFCFKY